MRDNNSHKMQRIVIIIIDDTIADVKYFAESASADKIVNRFLSARQ